MECIIPAAVLLAIVFGSLWEGFKPQRKRTYSYRAPILDHEDGDDDPWFEPRHVGEFMDDPGGYWEKHPNRSGAISAMLDDTLHGDEGDF
jgi:hypothetical protein